MIKHLLGALDAFDTELSEDGFEKKSTVAIFGVVDGWEEGFKMLLLLLLLPLPLLPPRMNAANG